MTLQQQLESARSHHQAGRLAEAERIYRQVLAQRPDDAEALHQLGMLAAQVGRVDVAVELMRRAIAICPTNAVYHSNLGNALMGMGQLDQAIAAYRQAIGLRPDFGDAHNNLGIALRDQGQLDQAVAAYRRAMALNPNAPEPYYNLGNALNDKGQLDEALVVCRHAVELKPDLAAAHLSLGNVLKGKGQLDEAIAAYRRAIGFSPGLAEAHSNLGNALTDQGKVDQAIAAHRQALGLKPDSADAHYNLGVALQAKGELDQAVASYWQAIRLKPDYVDAHNNLGNALTEMGQLDEAIASYRQAIRLKPDLAEAHSVLVFFLHYHPGYDAKMIYEELCRWNQRHAEPIKKFIQRHHNNRDSERRLRVGYVSPDFRQHVVGQNLLPLLREHDRAQTEIFCYANMVHDDAITQQIRGYSDAWRSIVGLSDAQAANLIRQDGIDILVDLSAHTGHNRLLVFARKPAPVQVTYLGCCTSTGMETMDYRLSDPHLDPLDSDLSCYRERTVRLPESYWCYRSTGPTPQPSPLPAVAMGSITFGCLNNFVKASPPALDLWREILQRVPRSRLIVHSHPGTHLDAVRERFAGKGISPDRLEFYLEQGNWPKYVQTYGRIDIALDPFPWGGGITTCDALWMGVPVVSLIGRTAVGRGGSSILANVGVPELIARTPEQYVQIAKDLANDIPRLAELRRTMRARMQASPLMDAPRFARNIEAAYRQMWRNWCEHTGGSK